MSKTPLVPHDHAAKAIETALRMRIGRGKEYTFQGVADATGLSCRAVESYVQGATPGLHAFLSLCAVLGPGFASDVLRLAEMSAQSVDPAAPEHMRILTSLGAVTAQVAEAMQDGHVDHREAAQIKPLAEELMQLLEPVARNGAIPMKGVVS